MTAVEWTLYNILDLKFRQGRRMSDIANRLAISESDLYRKQRAAIDEVARMLTQMEQRALTSS
jgi:DNA-directed RNA polymerase specialized sigma subunit